MKRKNERKYVKGITLIALVITIIVLLILAGVSLNLVSGSNGILNRVSNAVNATKQAQLEEELQLALAEIMMDYYIEGNGKTLQEYIIEQCNKPENNGMLEVGNGTFSSIDGDLYYTDSNGNISMIQVTDKGEVSIEGSVSADGTVNDTNPPTIFATTTTNTISLVIKDSLSGVAGWAYSTTNAEPTMWNEVSGKPKSHSETITGLTNGTTYYIWAKDANGNKSQVKEITTKNFDELSYDVTWEGLMATITVKKPTTGVQYLNTEGNWVDYTTPISIESGTTVQFKVTDGNNEKTYEAVKPLKKSTITYDANGGTGTFSETAEHTTSATVNFVKKPTRTNYEFVGWSLKPDVYYADYAEDGTNSFEMGTEDVNLYAIWKGTTKETMNPANYGDKVNYSANGVDDWEIFYNDAMYIYLITTDIVTADRLNRPSNIYTRENLLYTDDGNSEGLVSWMTDTSYWTAYATSLSGATACGGPTLDLLLKSYNAAKSTSLSEETNPVLSRQHPWVTSHNYWLAKQYNYRSAWFVMGSQLFATYTYDYYPSGIRPLVYLPSGVTAQKNGDTWTFSN